MTQADKYMALLRSLGACEEARREAQGKGLGEVWSTCKRGDWLLWLVAQMIGKEGWPTHQQVVLAACACAETALKYVPAGEKRPAEAIRVAREWCEDRATLDEVRDAAHAAYAVAAYADAAYADAAYAAYAAAYAAYAVAAYAVADAAHAAYASDADIVRSLLTVPQELP